MKLIYLGREYAKGGRIGQLYESLDGMEYLFKKKLYPCSIGGIVEVEDDGDAVKGAKFVGMVEDRERYDEIRARSRRWEGEHESRKEAKKTRDDSYTRAVNTLRSEYRNLRSRRQQTAFIANLIHEIQTG